MTFGRKQKRTRKSDFFFCKDCSTYNGSLSLFLRTPRFRIFPWSSPTDFHTSSFFPSLPQTQKDARNIERWIALAMPISKAWSDMSIDSDNLYAEQTSLIRGKKSLRKTQKVKYSSIHWWWIRWGLAHSQWDLNISCTCQHLRPTSHLIHITLIITHKNGRNRSIYKQIHCKYF